MLLSWLLPRSVSSAASSAVDIPSLQQCRGFGSCCGDRSANGILCSSCHGCSCPAWAWPGCVVQVRKQKGMCSKSCWTWEGAGVARSRWLWGVFYFRDHVASSVVKDTKKKIKNKKESHANRSEDVVVKLTSRHDALTDGCPIIFKRT